MSFRRPRLPKISRKVPRPKKSLRKLRRKSTKPRRVVRMPPTTRLQHSKKKKTVSLGVCYAGPNCTGKILLKRTTKSRCRIVGGKSWRGQKGCQKIKR